MFCCCLSRFIPCLLLSCHQSETSVFCGGVDPAVVQYSFMSPSADSGWRSWVRSSVRTHHTHDVRASVVADNVLVTAGKYVCYRGQCKKLQEINSGSMQNFKSTVVFHCICLCVCVCVCVCMYVCVDVGVGVHISVCVCMYTCVDVGGVCT